MANTFYTSSVTGDFKNILFQTNGIGTNHRISAPEKNWAFIDMQNLYKGVQSRGWRINWKLFREYLQKELNVTRAVVFMGYIKENTALYNSLKRDGFVLKFRKVTRLKDGKIDGGNIDADLASYVMDHKDSYQRAVIVADDGDYYRMIKSLIKQNKLERIISSHSLKDSSKLLKEIASEFIMSIESIRRIIEYK